MVIVVKWKVLKNLIDEEEILVSPLMVVMVVLVVKNLIVEERVDKGGDPDEAEHRLVAAGQLLATLHLRVTPNQFLVVICFLYLHQFITYLYS